MEIIVEHTVREYGTWKAVFDEHEEIRRRYGATGHEVYRGLDDPNVITVVNHFSSAEDARRFADDPTLREAMRRGGVIGEPRITWAEEADAVDYRKKAA